MYNLCMCVFKFILKNIIIIDLLKRGELEISDRLSVNEANSFLQSKMIYFYKMFLAFK